MSDLVRREDVLRIIERELSWPDTFHQELLALVKRRIVDLPGAKLAFAEVYDDIGAIKDRLVELESWL